MALTGHAQIDQLMVVEVEISSLSTAGSPRTSGADPEHVETLAEVQTPLPPITVHRSTMRVIDGLHRVRAAELRGQRKIAARFFEGDEADAFVLAVESNVTHGLPLTTADRKRAAGRIIASHPQWSDRMIASVTGIAPGTVAEIRRRRPGGRAGEVSRIGQDGRVRPVNGTEGRRLASRLIAQDPSLSLRQVARAASISPETVRDVRNRMMRGEDPLPGPRRGNRKRANGAEVPAAGRGGLRPAAVACRNPVQDRAAVLDRLRADPALRFSETGRTLLRLLTVHMMSPEEWDAIIDKVPPHCGGVVARLAGECAEMWAEFAQRVERKVAETA
ncbi:MULTISPECIES: ParB/RepB/Spo0J family partition protein [Streptomyces]|uniref:ParB/RepB/Spo0J family partition protein n=1 Tax=Streptomyces TaxID=1883 RepID=UPI001D14BCF9|nr:MULTISPECIES: ParB/RepB/Spo0J family partition protein [Streptomyces]MCC3650370.1 ParB/RepB/Spo0J family partition protein [Streptomyces sp. S07_1.15]WSQ74640.1 ParB/RepB/Spo0J family partition protein [Streptomyces xinghaiensis]